MTRAIFDTNLLASGLVGLQIPTSTPGQLLQAWQARRFDLVLSDHILTELLSTLQDPYFRRRLSTRQIQGALRTLRRRSQVTPLTVSVSGVATHPEDDLILAAAVSAGVDYLVTGDGHLQRLGTYEGVEIVSPRQFLELLEAEDSGVSS